ncbi:MAG: ABC transporter permease [Bryobacteraceae bacterium]
MSTASPAIHEAGQPEVPVIVLEPSRGYLHLKLREVWEYRELLYFLTWRDVKVRYRQTAIGAAWVVIQPLMTMLVFTVLFGRLAKMPSDGLPYPIFAFAGLLPWQLFSSALTGAANSLVGNQNLIAKVYFPRLIIPLSGILGSLVDFAVSFAILLVLMAYYRIWPTAAVWALPLFILLAMTTALAVGLWSAALNVKYRDVRHIIGFVVQFWMYATPVAYPSSLIPEKWRVLMGLNPMSGVVEGFRWALLGGQPTYGPLLGVSIVAVLVLLIGGLIYFRRTESTFADII